MPTILFHSFIATDRKTVVSGPLLLLCSFFAWNFALEKQRNIALNYRNVIVSTPVRRKLAIWNHIGLNKNLKSDDTPRKLRRKKRKEKKKKKKGKKNMQLVNFSLAHAKTKCI